MTATIRFPRNRAGTAGQAETSQIIQVFGATNSLPVGGQAVYASIAALRPLLRSTESPYVGIMVEFRSTGAQVIGNGTTELVGLFGEINPPDSGVAVQRMLLGILGFSLAAGSTPQIPIRANNGAAGFWGSAFIGCNVTAFDRISVGSAGAAAIVVNQVSCFVRPFHHREYLG